MRAVQESIRQEAILADRYELLHAAVPKQAQGMRNADIGQR
jgi:hypothetical protein